MRDRGHAQPVPRGHLCEQHDPRPSFKPRFFAAATAALVRSPLFVSDHRHNTRRQSIGVGYGRCDEAHVGLLQTQ